jgi:peptide deformylase
MILAMHEAAGLGLASTQIGRTERMAIVSADEKAGHETVLINPEIVDARGWEEAEEGCLSLPGIYVKIGRYTQVRVRYHDLEGRVCEMTADDLPARAVQHELDHLDGRLLVDRMTPLQRVAQRRRLRELVDRYDRRTRAAAAGPVTRA